MSDHTKKKIERYKLSEPCRKKTSLSSQKTWPFYRRRSRFQNRDRMLTTMVFLLSLLLAVQPPMRSTRTDLTAETREAKEQTNTRQGRRRSLQPRLRYHSQTVSSAAHTHLTHLSLSLFFPRSLTHIHSHTPTISICSRREEKEEQWPQCLQTTHINPPH